MKRLVARIYVWILGHAALYRVNTFLLSLVQRSLGINNSESDYLSGEAYFLRKVVKEYNPTLIFDVGAHTGDYSEYLRKLGYSSTIYLFEPHPSTFQVLQSKFADNPQSKLFNIGFSDNNGTATLYDHIDTGKKGSEHATLFADVITDFHGSKTSKETTITLETLDVFVNNHNIERISLLKLDTEGNEFRILHGGMNFLKAGKIDIIHFEFGDANVVSRVFFKDFYDLLSPSYDLFRLLPNGMIPIKKYKSRQLEIPIYQNIVAIKKK